MIQADKLYTAQEVAEILGVHLNTARKYLSEGRIGRIVIPHTKAFFCKGDELIKFQKNNNAGNEWLSSKQVADILKIRVPAVNYLVRKGKLKCDYVKNQRTRVRFNKHDVFEFEKIYKKNFKKVLTF